MWLRMEGTVIIISNVENWSLKVWIIIPRQICWAMWANTTTPLQLCMVSVKVP